MRTPHPGEPATARTLSTTYGAWMGEGVMVVNDTHNDRFLIFVD